MVIALVPQHAEAVGPPRVLSVPFIMGRPFGAPGDALLQHRVLDAALALLRYADGPIFEYYEEEAPFASGDADVPWSCPVSFPQQSDELPLVQKILDEIDLLMPWYEKGKAERGHTAVGLSDKSLADAVRFLTGFIGDEMSSGDPAPDSSTADAMKYAAEDMKAFYNEAATSQPGQVSAREAEDWYWGDTAAGNLVREIKKAGKDHADPTIKLTAGLLLVPHSQVFRDQVG